MNRVEKALARATETRALLIGSGVLPRVAELFNQQFPDARAVIIADPNTWQAAGATVEESLRQAGIPQEKPFIISSPDLYAEWRFIEQLEKMNQISVTRLTKSQIITIPMLAETPAVSPIDAALDVFRQKMCTALDEWRSGKMSASACASECEQLYEDATEEVAIILQKADNGNSIGKVPCGRNIPESVGHAFCMTALTAVCEATFHQVLSQETDNALVTSLLPFFYKDLGGDWLSFIEAAKAISELALDGSSPALHQESAAIKSQFQSLCRPFLAIVANQEGSCPSKGCINL